MLISPNSPEGRAALASVANEVCTLSRRGGAPTLTEDSEAETLATWLQWNDPNGCHTSDLALRERCEPYTVERAWSALANALDWREYAEGTEFTTWGPCRGQGPIRTSRTLAERDARTDARECARHSDGAYSDRRLVIVVDERLQRLDGTPVWPAHGRSTGSVRVIR